MAHGGESTSSNTVGAHSKMTGYTGSTHQGQGAKFPFLSGGPEFLAVHLDPLNTADVSQKTETSGKCFALLDAAFQCMCCISY